MSNPKTSEKQPERLYKVNGQTVSKADYQRYADEMRALREKEYQLGRVCLSQNGRHRW